MQQASLRWMAASATLHCLTGCTIGEVLGLVIGEARGWDNVQTIPLSIVVMEIVDTSVMAIVPGAMEAGLNNLLLDDPADCTRPGVRSSVPG